MSLVLWCANERGYFLHCFSLMLVEMNGPNVSGCLIGMVIWADCFVLLGRNFLGQTVGADMLMEVVVVVGAVDVVRTGFFVFFRRFLSFIIFPKKSRSKRTIKHYKILRVLKHHMSE